MLDIFDVSQTLLPASRDNSYEIDPVDSCGGLFWRAWSCLAGNNTGSVGRDCTAVRWSTFMFHSRLRERNSLILARGWTRPRAAFLQL